jgi:hypothetical protein
MEQLSKDNEPLGDNLSQESRHQFACPGTREFNLRDFFNSNNKTIKFRYLDRFLSKLIEDQYPNDDVPAEGYRQLIAQKLGQNIAEIKFRGISSKEKDITWADIVWLLETQPSGQPGQLLTDGQYNLFFINYSLLFISWHDGWDVFFKAIDGVNEWNEGDQVIFRCKQEFI